MARTARALLLQLTLVLLVVGLSRAQGKLPDNLGEFYSFGDNYFFEVITMPGTVKGKAKAVVLFRLTYDLLNFRKATVAYQRGSVYIATPSLYVEALGLDGVIVDRATWRDTARAEDFSQTNAKSRLVPGAIELSLRPGVYTIKYTFDDGSYGGGFTQQTQPIKIDDFTPPAAAIGLPLFVRSMSADTLLAEAIDGNASFGRRLLAYVPLASREPPGSLRYEVLGKPDGESTTYKTVQSGFGTLIGRATLGRPIPSGDDLRVPIIRRDGDSAIPSDAYAGLIDASTDDMAIGDYILLLTYEAGMASVTDSVRFTLRWVDMPITLARTDYALRALYPIATDETIDILDQGEKPQQRRALDNFWAPRDPTPATRFNEAMAEYYRRVDYAYFNFKTIGQVDGVFTDRGKIYILNGPPSEVRRDFQPDSAPREMWIYRNRVGRKFIFADDGKIGEYKLVEYRDLTEGE